MKSFRIRIEVDITARDREQAERMAGLLYSDLEYGRRPWVQAVLPDGIEERQTINPKEVFPMTNTYLLDAAARMREAGSLMRETLICVAQVLADFKPDFLRQLGLDAALEKVEATLAIAGNATAGSPIVTVSVQGGLIENLEATVPMTVVVEDWDVPDEQTGKKPTRSVHALIGGMSGLAAEKLRSLIAEV